MPSIDEYFFDVPPQSDEATEIRKLMAFGDFEYVEPDWIVFPAGCPDDQSSSPAGDNFSFEYFDGSSWQSMVTVSKTADDDQTQVFVFPNPGSIGTAVQVRVVDTDRSKGNRDLDTIHVDHNYLVSQ